MARLRVHRLHYPKLAGLTLPAAILFPTGARLYFGSRAFRELAATWQHHFVRFCRSGISPLGFGRQRNDVLKTVKHLNPAHPKGRIPLQRAQQMRMPTPVDRRMRLVVGQPLLVRVVRVAPGARSLIVTADIRSALGHIVRSESAEQVRLRSSAEGRARLWF